MLKILFENVIYRLFGFVPIYHWVSDTVVESPRPQIIIEKFLTLLVIAVCVPYPTKWFCKFGKASDYWRDREIDEENFKEDCFIIRFKKRGGERMKKLVVTILTVVLLPLTTYAADSNLVNQIMADATYEQSKGQTKGMDYCYTLESQQIYYKKYKPIVRDEGIAQRIELYIDSKCELGAYMYSNPDYDYKAVYSIQHPRVIINQILNRSKYGDKVHIRDWKDDRYR